MMDLPFRMLDLPPHKGSLTIEHNPHKDLYQAIREYIEDNDIAPDFENPEAMEFAINTDSLWIMRWYPDTPVGFCRVAASSLEGVVRLAMEGR